MAGIDALIDEDGTVNLTTESQFLRIVLDTYARDLATDNEPPSPETKYEVLMEMTETRLAVSEALKSADPEPAFVEVLQYAHREVAKEMGSETRRVWRVVQQGADDPFDPAAGPFGDDMRPDSRQLGTGVTSWWDWDDAMDEEYPYRGRMRNNLDGPGSMVSPDGEPLVIAEYEVKADQVLGRIGDMRDAGEVLVARNPDVVKRLMAGEFPIVTAEMMVGSAVESVIELACRSAECAPPPVGKGGSLPAQSALRSIPDSVPQSPANLDYKGTFKVPSSGTLKKTFGKTVDEQVAYFGQKYGISLSYADDSTSGDWAEERYASLHALDQMAQRYPDTFQGMEVIINRPPGFVSDVALFRWKTPEGEPTRQMTVSVGSSWILGRDATPNQRRRLYAAAVIHETGHSLTYDAVGRDGDAMQGLAWNLQPQSVGDKLLVRGSKLESVSEYATRSIAEDIAESFTAHILGIDPPDDVGRRHVAQHIEAIAASGAARPDAIAYLYAMAGDDDSTTASATIELACRSAECAPPPVGKGGSLPKTAPEIHWRVQEVIDDLKDVKSTDPRDEVFQFARQMMETREEAFARVERDSRGVADRPTDAAMESLKAEFDALSAVVPIGEGMVRRGTDDAAELEANARRVLPELKSFVIVGDVNQRVVAEAIEVLAQYPEAARSEIQSLVLGRYPEEVIGLHPGTRRAPGTVAAWGGHPTESGPYRTLWLTPRLVGASDAEIAEGIGTLAEPSDRQSEDVTVRMAEPERRHKIAIAHEMGHVLHSKAILGEKNWNRMGGLTLAMRDDPVARQVTQPGGRSRPIMTTKYGELNTAETVAESFALAALDGFDNITGEQQAVVRQVLNRSLGPTDSATITDLQFADQSDEDDDDLYGKGERFAPIIDTFQLPNE